MGKFYPPHLGHKPLIGAAAAQCATVTVQVMDAVVSSEPYGPELAARFHAAHVPFDTERLTVPVSASRIRADLTGGWDYLIPAAGGTGQTEVAAIWRAYQRWLLTQ